MGLRGVGASYPLPLLLLLATAMTSNLPVPFPRRRLGQQVYTLEQGVLTKLLPHRTHGKLPPVLSRQRLLVGKQLQLNARGGIVHHPVQRHAQAMDLALQYRTLPSARMAARSSSVRPYAAHATTELASLPFSTSSNANTSAISLNTVSASSYA